MNRCPSCGTTFPADAKYCTHDGSRLVRTVGAGPTLAAQPAERTRVDRVPPLDYANLAGKTLEGRSEIIRKVGEGGMSFVYLARDVATGTLAAIKVLSAALSQDANAMARLRREASLGM